MFVQHWASGADVRLTLKQHWVNVSFEWYLVISLVAGINAVNLYFISYCRPIGDRPTHARFAVEWIFNQKKKFVCDISGKKIVCFCPVGGGGNDMFSCWMEKNNLIRKKNHTPPLPVLNVFRS